ncbi:Uncharacterised protein [Actinobaculum suis]|uniref:PH domain-containing protein n=1 Tax=Actinobaculum suis TaxID=1657 RepID=A0A7Z8Y9H6_9ACTO|nr:PH domain-containing protein [Actinobaculum suis]VDG75897.1 Uncharacterised protein [Actinobaculum suis]
MSSTYRLRSATQKAAAIGFIAVGILAVVAQIFSGSGWKYVPSTAIFGIGMAVLGWAGFWLPAVTIDNQAVSFQNTFRTVRIPFSQISSVDSRFGLTVTDVRGRSFRSRCFGATGVGARFKATGEDVPVTASGHIDITTSTRSAFNLIEDLRDTFHELTRNSAGQRITSSPAWDRIAGILAGLAIAGFGIWWTSALSLQALPL